jgi:hypothetical protein
MSASPAPYERSRGQLSAPPMQRSARTRFQAVALLVREERARVNADETAGDAARADRLRRLDGIATILAKTAARDTSRCSPMTPSSPRRPPRSSATC